MTYDNHFGKIFEHNKIIETNNPYGYTGREIDTEDLYYYRARYYDPTIQSFISEDPIGFASGDFNWYRYVGNSPVSFVDSNGELWIFIVRVTIAVWTIYKTYETVKPYIVYIYHSNENLKNKDKETEMCKKIYDAIQQQLCFKRVTDHYTGKQIKNTCEFGKSVTGDIKTFGYKYR